MIEYSKINCGSQPVEPLCRRDHHKNTEMNFSMRSKFRKRYSPNENPSRYLTEAPPSATSSH